MSKFLSSIRERLSLVGFFVATAASSYIAFYNDTRINENVYILKIYGVMKETTACTCNNHGFRSNH